MLPVAGHSRNYEHMLKNNVIQPRIRVKTLFYVHMPIRIHTTDAASAERKTEPPAPPVCCRTPEDSYPQPTFPEQQKEWPIPPESPSSSTYNNETGRRPGGAHSFWPHREGPARPEKES